MQVPDELKKTEDQGKTTYLLKIYQDDSQSLPERLRIYEPEFGIRLSFTLSIKS